MTLPRRTAMAPRRRLRGARRYFRDVKASAAHGQVRVEPGSWWALWHYHADWPGWGNVRWRYRVEHIRALCTVYRSILDQAAAFETPFQAWISLDEGDAGQDATYLHTPNPHTPFPVELEVIWGPSPLEPLFSRLMTGVELRFGTVGSGQERLHIVWAPGFGAPLDGSRLD